MSTDNTAYAPFDGDGRVKVGPKAVGYVGKLYQSTPVRVTNGTARAIIYQLKRSGHSNHSGLGNVLWVVLAWLTHNGHAFEVHVAQEGGSIRGYYVEAKI